MAPAYTVSIPLSTDFRIWWAAMSSTPPPFRLAPLAQTERSRDRECGSQKHHLLNRVSGTVEREAVHRDQAVLGVEPWPSRSDLGVGEQKTKLLS
jgi:hypothetical protein